MSVALVAVIFVLWVSASPANSHLNVLISQPEVMKLLGLDAELYYVRGGVVNSYATSFVVPVPAHVADLHFTWQSLAPAPLPYVMGIEYESRGAMLPPQVNISERGLVPTAPQTFRVRLPCSGARSAEVPVRLQVNVTGADPRRRDVALLFKRNKICLKGVPWLPAAGEEGARGGEEAARATSGGVLYAAGGCAAAALALLAAGAALAALYSRPAKQNHHDINTSYTTTAYGSQADVVLRLAPVARAPGGSPGGPPSGPPSAAGSYATIASLHKFPFGSRRSPSPYATTHVDEPVYTAPESRVSYYAASNLTHVSQRSAENSTGAWLRALSTPRAALHLERLEHEGAFGQVYRGLWNRGDTCQEVLVKTVAECATATQAALLVGEGLRLHALQHVNVLVPVAACLHPPRAPLLLYPCTAHEHNLKRYLVQCRAGARTAPGARQLAALGAHAACGLAYLHAQRLVHADLAARNCLVDEKLRLKVTDNALSRDLFPEDYHCLGDNESRPVKWMAPETLLQGHYSTASDLWSLGVLLWELVTLGGAPLPELDAADVGACLAAGYRPHQPQNCPDHMYALMSWCWAGGVDARPSAPQLLAALHDFRLALTTYI